MKQIYNVRQTVRLCGEVNEMDTSIWEHLRLLDPENTKEEEVRIESFERLVEFVPSIWNASVGQTLFTKKPKVFINLGFNGRTSFTKKNFRAIVVRTFYKARPDTTMKDIINNLSADECCEYLRERNVAFSPDMGG